MLHAAVESMTAALSSLEQLATSSLEQAHNLVGPALREFGSAISRLAGKVESITAEVPGPPAGPVPVAADAARKIGSTPLVVAQSPKSSPGPAPAAAGAVSPSKPAPAVATIPAPRTMLRSEFNKLPVAQQNSFMRAGGRLLDPGQTPPAALPKVMSRAAFNRLSVADQNRLMRNGGKLTD